MTKYFLSVYRPKFFCNYKINKNYFITHAKTIRPTSKKLHENIISNFQHQQTIKFYELSFDCDLTFKYQAFIRNSNVNAFVYLTRF